ncbi:MAG: hypothetical protein LBH91_06900 [Prevotellaceae bacterium]|jgi:uncharacterized protein HemX|nr:hypothetical protein [Prevotellaceae bacterium]
MKTKITLIVLLAALLGLSSCGGRSSNNQNTHTHSENCAHEHQTSTGQQAPAQESFKAEADSTIKADTAPQSYSHEGCTHTH